MRDSYYIGIYTVLLSLFDMNLAKFIFDHAADNVIAAECANSTTTLLDSGFEYTSVVSPPDQSMATISFTTKNGSKQCYAIASTEGLFLYVPPDINLKDVVPNPSVQMSSLYAFKNAIGNLHIKIGGDHVIEDALNRLVRFNWELEDSTIEIYEALLEDVAADIENYQCFINVLLSRYTTPPTHLLTYKRLFDQTLDLLQNIQHMIDDVTSDDVAGYDIAGGDDADGDVADDHKEYTEKDIGTSISKAHTLLESFYETVCAPRSETNTSNIIDDTRHMAHAKALAFACVREVDRGFCIEEAIHVTEHDRMQNRCFYRYAALYFMRHNVMLCMCDCWKDDNPPKTCPYE